MRRALSLSIGLVLLATPALGQRGARAARATRGDFERAVRDRAPTELPGHPCDSEDPDASPIPPRPLSTAERASMLGRAIALPDGRTAAVVRTATGEADANGALAFALTLVVLARDATAWTTASLTALDTAGAPFEYDEPTVVVARLDDLDDDGERELLVVVDTNTETVCGPGYCSQRRTFVLDVAAPTAPVLASVMTRSTCQSDMYGEETGTVIFRDANGDGHRDLVHRVRACEPSEPSLEDAPPPTCSTTETTQLWVPGTDRYAPP